MDPPVIFEFLSFSSQAYNIYLVVFKINNRCLVGFVVIDCFLEQTVLYY